MTSWIWSHPDWPHFTWNQEALSPHLTKARLAQGKLLGITQSMRKDVADVMDALILADQAIDTSAIEGEHLNRDSVRSSIANRLGLDNAGMNGPPDRYVEGLLDMLLNATQQHSEALTKERLCSWHAALFPTGYSGIKKITVASFREPGPMQIVSGKPGREVIHYEAPPAEFTHHGMNEFLTWFNGKSETDGLIRAGIAHLWFELLHPFDDGNGRIGRAIIDLALAQDEKLASRYYSLSSAIMTHRKHYYATLGEACRGNLDITAWLVWFLDCFHDAISNALNTITSITAKSRFWETHAKTPLTPRQIKCLNTLLDAGKDGFIGGMTTRKYMHLTRTTRTTAYRELSDMVQKQCLTPTADKGRSAAYTIDWSFEKHYPEAS